MEFVLVLPLLVFFIAVLYQALMFELDVYNKMGELRYKVFHRAHEEQNEIVGSELIDEQIEGEPLSEIIGFEIPGQELEADFTYGPKHFYMRRGTKSALPDWVATALDIAIAAGLVADIYEGSSGHMGDAFESLDTVTSTFNSICD